MSTQQQWGIKTMWFDNEAMWLVRGDIKFQIEPLLFDNKQQAENYCQGLNLAWVEAYSNYEDQQ
jgi:tRNA(Ile)-lysidine synthase TilS/MesJ